jgi:hypothetical protein
MTHDRDFHASFPLPDEKLDYLGHLVNDTPPGLAPNIWNSRDDELFNDLPAFFQEGPAYRKGQPRQFPVLQIPTEKVLLDLVKDYLKLLRDQGKYKVGITEAYFHKVLKRPGWPRTLRSPILFKNLRSGRASAGQGEHHFPADAEKCAGECRPGSRWMMPYRRRSKRFTMPRCPSSRPKPIFTAMTGGAPTRPGSIAPIPTTWA